MAKETPHAKKRTKDDAPSATCTKHDAYIQACTPLYPEGAIRLHRGYPQKKVNRVAKIYAKHTARHKKE